MLSSKLNMLPLVSTSLVVLVWVSLLLGRIYYQSYIETLGLPRSESQLPLMDYALISANVTTLGVGLFVSVAIVIVVALSVRISRKKNWGPSIAYAFVSIGFVVLPAIAMKFVPREFILDLTEPLFPAIILVLHFLLVLMSLLLYVFAILSTPTSDGSSVQRSVFGKPVPEDLPRIMWRAFAIFLAAFLIVMVFIFCVIYARAFGVTDAENVLQNAKVAYVVFENSDYNERLCDATGDNCKLKVPLIGDRLIYLLELDVKVCDDAPGSKPPRLHAIPLEDVRIISYIDDAHGNKN